MSNPFIEPGSLVADQERRRRERFRIGVYAALGTATFFLAGMLIQGCQNQHQAADKDSGEPAAAQSSTNQVATNSPALASAPAAATNTTAQTAPVAPTAEPASETASAPATVSAPATAAPSSVMPASPASERFYVVKRGDSLARIAKAHNVSIKALKAANGLKSNILMAGRKLRIPHTAGNAAAPQS